MTDLALENAPPRRLGRRALVLRYALFAAVATAVNIATQIASFAAWDGAFALPLAMVLGTGTGLVVKYALDKRWIFFDRETGARAHGRKFGLYTLMGVATTAIFWSTEIAFDLAFEAEAMRYVGAALGLSVGYWVKYRLDRRFVFGQAPA